MVELNLVALGSYYRTISLSINQHVVEQISVDVNPNNDRLEKARKQQTDRPTNRNRKLVGRLSKFVACVLANRGGGRREGLVERDPARRIC
ncbi:hypothetical protein V1478_000635 [Vespula squamosa]|uniref:Uncharacterized protein n=1 Tax=Vespula squamosa TaxID=30214 RepID=A0ABD2C674_VESSQ